MKPELMSNDPKCPQCGAAIPPGLPRSLCSRCVLLGALHTTDEPTRLNSSDAGTGQRFPYLADYEIIEEISRGGMGIVFKARQRKLDRIVAVKMILSGEFASREQQLRFRVEAEAAARLQHPNIVSIYETGEQDGRAYFSMEFVQGGNLAALVREKPLEAKRAAGYVRTIAKAIHFAHEQGILHRDLKPSNVLIDHADQPRVTDFGLAKRMTTESFLTVTGEVMGSPSFMPPEQAGAKGTRAGRYSDVYGLGAILFYLLTGRPPFVAGSVAETLHHVLNTDPVSPCLVNPRVPSELATICFKCLEKEATLRYPSAQHVADELDRFLRDEPVIAGAAAWTDFNQTLWADPKFRGYYLEHADEIIPGRQYLFYIFRSFLNFFAPEGPLRICDLGCGDGALAEKLLEWRSGIQLTLVDGSVEMLDAAARRLSTRQNVRFIRSTFDHIIREDPLPDKFDAIISSFSIHHLTPAERSALFVRVSDHLFPGGWFLNLDVALPDEASFADWQFELWREWLIETDRQRTPSASLRHAPDESRQNSDNKYTSLSSQLNALRAAGFSNVDCLYRNSIFTIYSGRKAKTPQAS